MPHLQGAAFLFHPAFVAYSSPLQSISVTAGSASYLGNVLTYIKWRYKHTIERRLVWKEGTTRVPHI